MKRFLVVVAVVLSVVVDGTSVGANDRLVAFTYEVADEDGRPFPAGTAGLMVCPKDAPLLACDPMIFGPADANGVAEVMVDPAIAYRFTALVTGTEWPCGAWISPDGTAFFFSEGVVTRPGGAKRPGTFAIVEPTCSVSL